jgi:2-dehydropantoate 2-reductase
VIIEAEAKWQVRPIVMGHGGRFQLPAGRARLRRAFEARAKREAPVSPQKIVVAGAGSIGCFVGGQLAAAAHPVFFLARQRIVDEVTAHGLTLSDRDGGKAEVAAGAVAIGADPAVLASADVILVTVKSGATRQMAASIRAFAPASAVVVSLQNGIDNAAVLQQELPHLKVVAGMVPFNVVALGEGRFHRGTDGAIVIDASCGALAAALSTPHLKIAVHADMRAVAWGKLLLNLNNALNALAGLPLREEIGDRRWRLLLAGCMEEALAALTAAGIHPAKVGALPAAALPRVLRLPDFLFRIVAAAQLKIDPAARSSMQDDLEQRRTTEVDQLQGAVVALAARVGRTAPLNHTVLALVKAAEQAKAGSPRLQAADVAAA